MKVLMVDKFYFIKGGAERYYFELTKLLERHGHEVIPFAMRHPENFPSEWERYFVDNIEFNNLSALKKVFQAPRILSRVIYSYEAKAAIEELIRVTRPDIVHLHMIDHQISPSILHAIKKYGIPVVQTCHQYKLVCPNYRLYIPQKNELCERCKGKYFYNAVVQRCHKNSLAASLLVSIESYIHRWIGVYDLVDKFHVPSKFLGRKLIAAGISPERIWHQFYTIELADYPYSPEMSDYFVYYGRLAEEKGIATLLKAMTKAPQAYLKIVGEGPQAPALKNLANALGLSNVEFCGKLDGTSLIETVGKSRFVAVPSEWHDNSPLVIYESFSMGKPVVASNLGGMPELIEHGKDGFVFEAGNVDELAKHISTLWDSKPLCSELGRNARKKAEEWFDPEKHYVNLMELYNALLRKKQTARTALEMA